MASYSGGKLPLEQGQRINTILGETLTVGKFLGAGGQGSVFMADYAGQSVALKWYHQGIFRSPEAFKDNLRQNVYRGEPAKEFLWPKDMTEDYQGSFGYVMALRPKGYYEATEFLLRNQVFRSYRRAVDACLNAVSAFRQLHNAGLSYKDINGGNFFFNPENGRALICDIDNVGPSDLQTGIIGTPRYMAPEVVTGQSLPNGHTDRHSMAVLLFMLLCMGHPLEGRRALSPYLDAKHQLALYGADPIFVMDPDNQDNAADPVIHSSMVSVWNCFPQYMRDIFLKAFSHEALVQNPQRRPTEKAWLDALTRFRSDIVTCGTCGNEVFVKDGSGATCDSCHATVRPPCRLQLPGYALPLVADSRLYKCQMTICDADEALDPVAQVVSAANDPRKLGLRNVSDATWQAVTSKGEPRQVKPGEVIPIKPGISLTFGNCTAHMLNNQ